MQDMFCLLNCGPMEVDRWFQADANADADADADMHNRPAPSILITFTTDKEGA